MTRKAFTFAAVATVVFTGCGTPDDQTMATSTADSEADTEGAETEGADTESSDTEGSDTEGSDTEGADTEGSDTEGEVPAKVCIGWTPTGRHLATVYERDGVQDTELMCSGELAACGGDVVGSWRLRELCGFDEEVLQDPLGFGCPGTTWTLTSIAPAETSGPLTFLEDGTFSDGTDLIATAVLRVPDPQSCGMTCGQVEATVTGVLSDQATCEESEGACVCTLVDTIDTTLTGTYTTDATGLTQDYDHNDDTPDTSPYCVDGDVLTYWDPIYAATAVTDVACIADDDCAELTEHEDYSCLPPQAATAALAQGRPSRFIGR